MKVIAPAKINLSLLIVGRREDGMHLIESYIVFSDSLYDEITISRLNGSSSEVVIDDESIGSDNTVSSAMEQLSRYLKGAFRISVKKKIPIGAGVGGGSADAGAVLRYFGEKYSIPKQELVKMAASVGCDTVACLSSVPCYVTGIGEKVICCKQMGRRYKCLFVYPNECLRAGSVYSVFKKMNIPFSSSKSDVVFSADELLSLPNDLMQSAMYHSGIVEDVFRVLSECDGNIITKMCGSGSAFIAFFIDENHLESACNTIKKNTNWRVEIMSFTV